jgi:imidazolonepropionase-like amidohydrolase
MNSWQGLRTLFGLTAARALKRKLRPSLLLAALSIGICQSVLAQGAPGLAPAASTLFRGVRIFDGKSATLSASSDVLITGNIIERVSASPITIDAKANVQVVAGNGRVLMPGLSDMHWHAMMVRPTPAMLLSSDIGYTNFLAGVEATATLMRGFTTIRDLGGPAFSLKRAIDEGLLPGPRIYPSGAIITITSGHGNFRQLHDLPRTVGGTLTRVEQLGGSMIADSPDEVGLPPEKWSSLRYGFGPCGGRIDVEEAAHG